MYKFQLMNLINATIFTSLTPYHRLQIVKQPHRYLNCLFSTLMLNLRKASKCKICAKFHNILLHIYNCYFETSESELTPQIGKENCSTEINPT